MLNMQYKHGQSGLNAYSLTLHIKKSQDVAQSQESFAQSHECDIYP